VWDTPYRVQASQLADEQALGDPAADAHVGLNNVEAASVEHLLGLATGGE
jgi:hypothetical protein